MGYLTLLVITNRQHFESNTFPAMDTDEHTSRKRAVSDQRKGLTRQLDQSLGQREDA